MTLPFTTHLVDLLTYTEATDQYGDKTEDQSASPTVTTVPGVWQSYVTADDRGDPGRAKKKVTTGVLWLGPDAPIAAKTRVRIDGQVYELQGQPLLRRAPFGNLDHLVVNLSLIRG